MPNVAKFVSDNGIVFEFGEKGKNAFTMDIGNGQSVFLGSAQGFSQVGETLLSQSVGARTIRVRGVIYDNIEEEKKKLRKAFVPMSSGKLIINNEYYIRVFIKESPSFSIIKGNGKFIMSLYAPYPYFKSTKQTVRNISGISPLFKFPLSYEEIHKFGETKKEKIVSVINNGDVKTPISFKITAYSEYANPTIQNESNGEFLRVNITMYDGDVLILERSEHNIFSATLINGDGENDVLGFVDESSNFFEIPPGENVIVVNSVESEKVQAELAFEETVVSFFET